MLKELLLGKRALSLKEALSFLEEKLDTQIFISDLIQLIIDGDLKPYCYLNRLAASKVYSYCRLSNSEKKLWFDESWLLESFSTSNNSQNEKVRDSSPRAEPIPKIIFNLNSQKIESDETQSRDYLYEATSNISKKANEVGQEAVLAQIRHQPVQELDEVEFLTGIFELDISHYEIMDWFRDQHASQHVSDIRDIYFLNKAGDKYKRVFSDSRYEYRTRLQLEDIKLSFEELQTILKPSVDSSPKTKSPIELSSYVQGQIFVCRRYRELNKKEYISGRRATEIWSDLWQVAFDLSNEGHKIDPDRLFKKHVQMDTMYRTFKKFRDAGIDFPMLK